MGCHVYIKHSFMNDQEINRIGVATFATEQAIRELYTKPFEYAVRRGNADGIMTSFNLIGVTSSASYATNVQLYTNEWGYRGYSVTDYWNEGSTSGWDGYQNIRGLQAPLGNNTSGQYAITGTWDAADNTVKVGGTASPTQWYFARETFKRSCYTTVNGNGMDEGYAHSMIVPEDKTIGAAVSVPANTNVLSAAQLERLNGVFGTSGYTLTATGLPEGITMAEDGTLSGRTGSLALGVYEVTLSLRGKAGLKYITDSATFTYTVGAGASSDQITYSNDAATIATGTAYTSNIAQTLIVATGEDSNYFPGQEPSEETWNNGNGYIGYRWEASNLPAGLTLTADSAGTGATISGNPGETGHFTVIVNLIATHVTRSGYAWARRYGREYVTYTFYKEITVTAAQGTTPVTLNLGETSTTIAVDDVEALATTLTGYVPTRAGGYTFSGWATTANGEVIDVSELDALPGTLYAVWEAPQFAIIDGFWYIGGVNTGIAATGANGVDGVNGTNGKDGLDGVDGIDGLGIENIEIIGGELIITYSNGQSVNLGKVVGDNGADGTQGPEGPQGPAGPAGSNGADGASGGCGGNVETTLMVVGASFALIATADRVMRSAVFAYVKM